MRLERYGMVAIALHWVSALLIAVNWPLGYFGEAIEQAMGQPQVALHKSIGLTVLALGFGRLVWRLLNPPPPLPGTIAPWRASVARLTHWGLYAMIIAVPLSGWLRTSAGRYPLTWFGLVELPKFPIERESPEALLASSAHGVLGWMMLALMVLHIAAALHHHFRLKDSVLLRMLPERSSATGQTLVEAGPNSRDES